MITLSDEEIADIQKIADEIRGYSLHLYSQDINTVVQAYERFKDSHKGKMWCIEKTFITKSSNNDVDLTSEVVCYGSNPNVLSQICGQLIKSNQNPEFTQFHMKEA